jgi:hypothetical protein
MGTSRAYAQSRVWVFTASSSYRTGGNVVDGYENPTQERVGDMEMDMEMKSAYDFSLEWMDIW